MYTLFRCKLIEITVKVLGPEEFFSRAEFSPRNNAEIFPRFELLADIHPFMHTITHRRRSRCEAESGAIRVRPRRLAQVHHDTQLVRLVLLHVVLLYRLGATEDMKK